MTVQSPGAPSPKRIVVLISGSGSNLQALLDAGSAGQLGGGRIIAVISNRPGVQGLERARQAGVPAEVLDHRPFPERAAFDQALIERIDHHQPDLVVLAGFMRILTPELVRHYAGRMLNIHPSLLPLYPGLNTHQRAIEAGDTEHGATVHFVTEELDGGPGVALARVPIHPDDTPESLAARVLTGEHRLYPTVVRWFCSGRLTWRNRQPVLDQQPLTGPVDIAKLS